MPDRSNASRRRMNNCNQRNETRHAGCKINRSCDLDRINDEEVSGCDGSRFHVARQRRYAWHPNKIVGRLHNIKETSTTHTPSEECKADFRYERHLLFEAIIVSGSLLGSPDQTMAPVHSGYGRVQVLLFCSCAITGLTSRDLDMFNS